MTIELTIRLPGELHRRLEARAQEKGQPLDQVLLEELEKGLEIGVEPAIEQERVLEALHSTGLIQPISPELVQRYMPDPNLPRQKPLKIPGKPLSEVIIEQRGKLQ
jgi:predicted DNA-binding protein